MALDMNLIAFLIFVAFMASTVKQTTGFGFSLVSVPLLLPFLSLTEIVPIIIPLVMVNDYLIAIGNRNALSPRSVLPMAAAAVIGIPIGIIILSEVDETLLTVVISVVILISGFFLLSGKTIQIRRERLTSFFVGFTSGLLCSTSGLGGPPITLFLINQRWNKLDFRNNLGLYFSIIDTFTAISLLVAGFITKDTITVDLILLIPVLAGSLAGRKLITIIDQPTFTKVTVLIVMTGAIFGLANELFL